MKLWIFDNDGTLYNSKECSREFKRLFDEYFSRKLGYSVEKVGELSSFLREKHQTGSSVWAFSREFGVSYQEGISETFLRIDLGRGISNEDFSEKKRALEGVPGEKIVFTNNPVQYANRVLEHIGLAGCFSWVVGIEELDFFEKPHPHAYAYIENRFHNFSSYVLCDDSLENLDGAQKRVWETIWYNPTGGGGLNNHRLIRSFSEL